MGFFDTFIDFCPYCGSQEEVDSKLTERPMMNVFYAGDRVKIVNWLGLRTGPLMSKRSCSACERRITLLFSNYIFAGFVKAEDTNPRLIELPFGRWFNLDDLKEGCSE